MVTIDDVRKIKIKAAKIIEAEDHPDADRLYVLKIDIGEEELRTIVAGIKKSYTPEELVGKKILVIANLEPAEIRGVTSNGMLLAARVGEDVFVISPDVDIEPGIVLS